MEINLKQLYAQSLGIKAPWKVTGVKILDTESRVEVRVACSEKTVWTDPESKERAHVHGWSEQTWRHLDTCEFETIVSAKVPRLKLKSGKTITATVPWAEPGGRFSKRKEAHLIILLQRCKTVSGAASLGRITADEADGVMKRAVKRGLMRRTDEPMKHIGLDEKAIRKHHNYATVLSDIERGSVHDVVEGRTKEVTGALLKNLAEISRESIEAVAMDMWKGYQNAVAEELPEAAIVFDKFHVTKYLNEAVNRVRIREHRELSASGDDTLKGSKYQWLKRHKDMRLSSAIEFRKLLGKSLRTGKAWSLKELFNKFWGYRSPISAMRFLSQWIETAYESGIKPMEKVAEMIDRHLGGLINYIIYPITNAGAEGLNSMIQELRCVAKGLPNFESFRGRILFHLGKLDLKPAL